MGDPLSDPRAAKLLSASTGEIASLAGAFRSVGVQAEVAAAGLRGAQNDATWTGEAARAFRAQVGRLPGQLDRVQHSYNEVATALYRYESALGPVQSQFRSLAAQLASVRSSLATAQGRLASARSALSSATSAPHAKPTSPAVIDAHTAVAGAAGAVGNLQGQVSGLESRGYQLLDEFDTVRGHATSAVSGAAGLAPTQSWWMGALNDVGNFMAGAGHVLLDIGKGVVNAAESLPGDVVNVFEHPLSLEAWGHMAEDLGTVAGAVALLAAVVVFPADVLGLDAAAGIAAVGETADSVALGANIASTVTDGGQALEGKGSWGRVGIDVVGDVAAGTKLPGLSSAEARAGNLADKSAALEDFGLSRAEGLTPSEAYSGLSAEQRQVLTKSVAKLSDPARLSYMRSSTEEALSAAESVARRELLPNALAHTAVDKVLLGVKDAYFPSQPAAG